MKQFKAEWQYNRTLDTESYNESKTIDHLITQHNALCDYLAAEWKNQALEQAEVHEIEVGKQTITLPKPEWWDKKGLGYGLDKVKYREALEAASKASGILFTIE